MPKLVDHEAYRRELLQGSYEIFVRLGFASCTMRVLARELEVSTGTLYHYFDAKEDVFAQLVALKENEWSASWAKLVEEQPRPLSVATFFSAVADAAVDVRKLELLRLEAERHMPEHALRRKSHDTYTREVGALLGIEDSVLCELVTTTLRGLVMASAPLANRDAFLRQGALLEAICASRASASPFVS